MNENLQKQPHTQNFFRSPMQKDDVREWTLEFLYEMKNGTKSRIVDKKFLKRFDKKYYMRQMNSEFEET